MKYVLLITPMQLVSTNSSETEWPMYTKMLPINRNNIHALIFQSDVRAWEV